MKPRRLGANVCSVHLLGTPQRPPSAPSKKILLSALGGLCSSTHVPSAIANANLRGYRDRLSTANRLDPRNQGVDVEWLRHHFRHLRQAVPRLDLALR